ncbi:hypothetical protein HMSSN036_69130 [Paenibacillus macerans]|nr:hypothetical protein HMSSN036_69130 [Paenibacillus macerans]
MYTLLIADDEALEREGLELMIGHMLPDTFRFLHAENGRRAIQLAEEARPDFIFMDIKMPGIPGLEAVREILARQPGTPVVIITAHDYFAYAKEGAGARGARVFAEAGPAGGSAGRAEKPDRRGQGSQARPR